MKNSLLRKYLQLYSFDPNLFNVYAVANKNVNEADLENAI
jgi:hypothetical protein